MVKKTHKPEPAKRKRKTTIEECRKALLLARGQVSPAATYLGITRKSLHDRIARHEVLREALVEAREATLSTAFMTIDKAIKQGDIGTSKWYLSVVGPRTPGYEHFGPAAVQHEHEHSMRVSGGDRYRSMLSNEMRKILDDTPEFDWDEFSDQIDEMAKKYLTQRANDIKSLALSSDIGVDYE